MASNSLNAGASSFTPTVPNAAPPTQDSFTEYAEMVETIEGEMHDDSMNDLSAAMNNSSVAPPPAAEAGTGLPSHLAKHATEFWFAEARDCTCCNGFKFRCPCTSTRGACKCSPDPGMGAVAPSRGGGGGKKKAPMCKFFAAGNCRFGDQCRFSHS